MTSPPFPTFVAPPAPTPVPSPPPLDVPFAGAVESHYIFHGTETRLGHRLYTKNTSLPPFSSSPTRDWRLSITALYLSAGDAERFYLHDLPPHLSPFFAYRDVAIYMPDIRTDSAALFYAIYREWYPTRDRSLFKNGIFKYCGAPFFSSTIRVNFEDHSPQPHTLLKGLVHWHSGFSHHLNCIMPRFRTLKYATRLLVRPGLSREQSESQPNLEGGIDYTPAMRRTFSECFIWVEQDWEDMGVRLVVLNEDMLHRISSNQCQGLTRDVDLEAQAKEDAIPVVKMNQEQKDELTEDNGSAYNETLMNHVSVWRGSLEDVMRAVVAGDERRKGGIREFNDVMEEWLGEGVTIGKSPAAP